jgi:anti-sigma regulatory factor (Ser/Thr protein kinase)
MKKIDITLHSGFYPTTEIRDFIGSLCQRIGLTAKLAYQIKTVIDEAMTNVVRHAYQNKPGKIKMQVKYHRNTLTISIKDWGKPLAHHKKTGPTDLVELKKDHGLGLVMIDRIMDKVQRVRRNSYNELIMKKHLNNL